MVTSEIDGEKGLQIDTTSFANELQQVIHDVGKQIISDGIQPKSAQRYERRIIQRVNREEE